MDNFFWYLIVSIAVVNWLIYISVTLPKLRMHRTIYLSDWGFGIGKPFKTLHEYKDLCERDNETLFWYKLQIFLISAFVILILAGSLSVLF